MPTDIDSRLESFALQCDQLLIEIRNIRASRPSLGNQVGKDVLGNAVAELVSGYFEIPELRSPVRKYSKRFIDEQHVNQQQNSLNQAESRFNNLLTETKAFLSTISVKTKDLTIDGNSSLLISRIDECNEYSKLESRIRHLASSIRQVKLKPLLNNSEIPAFLESRGSTTRKRDNDYAIFSSFENRLRSLVELKLKSLTINWWKERMPEDARLRAEERKIKTESSDGMKLHPIHYVDFADYNKIILRNDNWSQAFKTIFGDKTSVEVKLKELEPIRNNLAHSRKLSKEQSDKLRIYSNELLPV